MEVPRDKARIEDNPKVISPPIITQPLYGCAKSVNITGYIPNATLDLEVDGAVVVANFPGHSPTPEGALIKLPVPVPTNITRRVCPCASVESRRARHNRPFRKGRADRLTQDFCFENAD